jgi:hypothetical protein
LTDRDRQSINFTFGHRGFFGYMGARPDEMIWWSNLWRQKELTKEELNDLWIMNAHSRDSSVTVSPVSNASSPRAGAGAATRRP